MIERRPARRGGGDAAALRFLLLLLAGWAMLRVAMLWNPAIPVAPRAIAPPWAPPPPFVAPARDEFVEAAPRLRIADPESLRQFAAQAGERPPLVERTDAGESGSSCSARSSSSTCSELST